MNLLLAGLIIFFGVHLLPNVGDTRARLIAGVGEKLYMSLYSLLSLAGLLMLSNGKARADWVEVWQPPEFLHNVTLGLMFLSVLCFAAMFFPNNIRRVLGHPMLLFVALWGAAHLASNGDLASILLFGSFAVFSVFKIFSLNLRKPRAPAPVVGRGRDLLVITIAAAVYGVVLFLHPYISGGYKLLT